MTAGVLLWLLAATASGARGLELRGAIEPAPGTAVSVSIYGTATPYVERKLIGPGRQFRFRGLPPGAYMVVVFIPGQGEVRQTMEVTESLADRKGVITVILKVPPVDTTSLRNRHTVSARELTISEGARREYAAAERELKRLDVPAARRHFERAVTLAPQFAAAWNYLGTLSYQAGNYAEAERMFRRALQAGPGTFEPVVNLGGVLLNLGRYQEALAYNQHATLERPRDALSQSQLGMNYFFLGQLEPAREHLRIAKRLDPAHFSQPQLVLAEIYLRLGDRTAALHEWREYLVLHPDAQNASKVRQSIRKLESQPATPVEK